VDRFTSADPIFSSIEVQEPQSLNRYSYVLGNPLKFVDPTGKKTRWADGFDPTSANGKRLVSALAETYSRPGGRAALEGMRSSDITFEFGERRINPKNPGTFGFTSQAGIVRDDFTGKVEKGNSKVSIDVDFKEIDANGSLGRMPNNQPVNDKNVTQHEVGHGIEVLKDPEAAIRRTQAESEDEAEKFRDKNNLGKPDMDKKEAERKVLEMMRREVAR
jgi:hypothetical protein